VDSDAEVAAARIGRVIGGRYRLRSVLGIGGMAAVYEAEDPTGHRVAIKLLHPEMAARREVRERFVREGTVSVTIDHPGVVQTLPPQDAGEDGFLVMELLEGETLRARVKRHGRLPLDEVLDHAEQILDVLVAAHDKGIVHRDLKPDNLFVTPDGRVKILDFGLARVLDGVPAEHRTRTGVALGTLAYMAPEQALGRRAEIDGRVDVFALGATMFRVLSGRRVHEAESEAELLMAMASRPAPPLASVAPDVSPSACAVVDLALAFSRDARYPDSRTMLGDVRALRAGASPPYATQRLASRDEATRADRPAPSVRTQPLGAHEGAPSQRGGTVPLAAYLARAAAPGAAYPTGAPPAGVAHGVADTAPMAAAGGGAVRTEPLPQHAPPVGVRYAGSGAPPAVMSGAPPQKRSWVPVVAVGAVSLATGIGITVWMMTRADESATAAPTALRQASSERATAVPAAPEVPTGTAPSSTVSDRASTAGAAPAKPAAPGAPDASAATPAAATDDAPASPEPVAGAEAGFVAASAAAPPPADPLPVTSAATTATSGAPAAPAPAAPPKHFGRGYGRPGRAPVGQ